MAGKPAFASGAQVEHQKFGLGTVVSCDDEHIRIKFDEHGEKKFVNVIALPAIKASSRQGPPAKKGGSKKPKAPSVAAASE